ncbi:alpha-1,3/1,6-mannosyltransferase ALG2 [Bacillus rossius redtenbacheri]|uniref:alpha-1,3/1,6-mannosyltransferase ALG2 n=1 Tax=Bacillus rossius redtenbacheri TaxID=93214 RepID=UPI002FDD7A58
MPRIVFLHPDLGIGGAERLVVDAALALKKKGHFVHFVTSHHDPSHCFTETKDGTLDVTVVGDWLPRHLFGKFFALCAYLRMLYVSIYLFFSDLRPDIVFCDLISVCVPILKLWVPHIMFYCHFPDQLLSQPGSVLKSAYRAPLNWLEEVTTGQASKIFVNSKFTAQVFKQTFKRIKVTPEILYPSINTDFFERCTPSPLATVLHDESLGNAFIFLSINRYERKKNLGLAIDAIHALKSEATGQQDSESFVHLIMAGGYDPLVTENVEYYEELLSHAEKLNVQDSITFLRSPSDAEKVSLLSGCDCLLYTPSNEHFGIVPLEAMYYGKPVIAVNSGGPTETIVDGETGFLCNPSKDSFSAAMLKCTRDEKLCTRLGSAGKQKMLSLFSFTAFTDKLDSVVGSLMEKKSKGE